MWWRASPRARSISRKVSSPSRSSWARLPMTSGASVYASSTARCARRVSLAPASRARDSRTCALRAGDNAPAGVSRIGVAPTTCSMSRESLSRTPGEHDHASAATAIGRKSRLTRVAAARALTRNILHDSFQPAAAAPMPVRSWAAMAEIVAPQGCGAVLHIRQKAAQLEAGPDDVGSSSAVAVDGLRRVRDLLHRADGLYAAVGKAKPHCCRARSDARAAARRDDSRRRAHPRRGAAYTAGWTSAVL